MKFTMQDIPTLVQSLRESLEWALLGNYAICCEKSSEFEERDQQEHSEDCPYQKAKNLLIRLDDEDGN